MLLEHVTGEPGAHVITGCRHDHPPAVTPVHSDDWNPDGFPYTLTRMLDAPAAKVWRAWTTAEEYAQWAQTYRQP